ncbi:MAG: tRNA (guanosine(46)-N7)-methyltransferase TrmB [Thermoanaerobaculales bacterium]|nr:tRNA (guanosine(46)-N7)-methyltransferase TrmB [Thermoanaerobaculales bacterium]
MVELDLNAIAIPIRWSEVFGRTAPVDVEIGSGKGKFLLELAAERPDRDILAVERSGKYHRLCCDRAARRGIANVRLLRTTAEDLLFRLLEPASVGNFFVLFPDPWPKKRHHKRRLITTDVVAALHRALVPGGRLLVKTDHEGYSEVISEVLAAAEDFDVLDPDEAYAGLPVTGFEHKYRIEGRPIYPFALRKRD